MALLTQGSQPKPVYGITFWLARSGGVSTGSDAGGRSTTPRLAQLERRDMTPRDMFMAAPAGKRRLFLIPSLKMVVVRR